MHRRTILASESTLDDISSPSVSGCMYYDSRRDEEIGADSNYTDIVRLQPASEQGINTTSGQSWITISPHLCQCIIFIIMCKCPICSQNPYYRDQSEANSGKPSRDSLHDSCPRNAEAEDTRSLSSRNLQSPTKEIICQSVAYAHSGPESEEIAGVSSPEVRNSNTTTSRCTRYYTKRSHPSLR